MIISLRGVNFTGRSESNLCDKEPRALKKTAAQNTTKIEKTFISHNPMPDIENATKIK